MTDSNPQKNCILYLIRTSPEDLEMFNKSLKLVEDNVLPAMKDNLPDIVIFHEKSFDESYRDSVHKFKDAKVLFEEIELKVPDYPEEIKSRILDFYPHPTHGPGKPYAHTLPEPHKGFSLGYRSMCKFFAIDLYHQPILNDYKYYIRLDNDSYIKSRLSYSLFSWAESNDVKYGYIAPAVQIDRPEVVIGLWKQTKEWIQKNKIKTFVPIDSIEDGSMFYTNFELGSIEWFRNSLYKSFSENIDKEGMIYIYRHGDAPIRMLGVSLLMDPKHIKPITGFTYQHGAIYSV